MKNIPLIDVRSCLLIIGIIVAVVIKIL